MTTPEDIIAFCDGLRRSLLEAQARGTDITLAVKHDTEPVDDFGNVPTDYRWMGQTLTIKVGRPATEERRAMEADRFALVERLAR